MDLLNLNYGIQVFLKYRNKSSNIMITLKEAEFSLETVTVPENEAVLLRAHGWVKGYDSSFEVWSYCV